MGAQESPGSSCLSEYLPPSPPPPGPPLSLTQPGRPPPPEPGATVSLVALTQFVGPRGRPWTQCLPRRSSPVCPTGGRGLCPDSQLWFEHELGIKDPDFPSGAVPSLQGTDSLPIPSLHSSTCKTKMQPLRRTSPAAWVHQPSHSWDPSFGARLLCVPSPPAPAPTASCQHPSGEATRADLFNQKAGIGRPWAVAEPPSGAGGPDCPPACPVSRGRGGEGEQSRVWRCSRSCPGGRPRRDHGSWETQD